MSSTEEVELKAGHPPAVKAGGMRVSRHRQTSSGEDVATKPVEEADQADQEEEETTQQEKPSIVIAGALTKGDKDFPPEAVKQYHEKPLPSKEQRPPNPQQKHNINQPR